MCRASPERRIDSSFSSSWHEVAEGHLYGGYVLYEMQASRRREAGELKARRGR